YFKGVCSVPAFASSSPFPSVLSFPVPSFLKFSCLTAPEASSVSRLRVCSVYIYIHTHTHTHYIFTKTCVCVYTHIHTYAFYCSSCLSNSIHI
uniref:Uncharacterized protein n=1 Tax=Chelydra serpentina TaxID=8475 RepID=A0A8C3XJP0_CHESE